MPEKILKFTRLERTRSIHAETYAFMRKKLEDARIGEASKIGNIRILDSAISNEIPISPSYPRNIFGGILFGFFFPPLGILIGTTYLLIILVFGSDDATSLIDFM